MEVKTQAVAPEVYGCAHCGAEYLHAPILLVVLHVTYFCCTEACREALRLQVIR